MSSLVDVERSQNLYDASHTTSEADLETLIRESSPRPQEEIGNDSKPPYSYAALTAMAIQSSPKNMLTLAEIYKWIVEKYPYYRVDKGKWQNSLRHNLSVNDYFVKVPRTTSCPGKGSFWAIDPTSSKNVFKHGNRQRRRRKAEKTAKARACVLRSSSVESCHAELNEEEQEELELQLPTLDQDPDNAAVESLHLQPVDIELACLLVTRESQQPTWKSLPEFYQVQSRSIFNALPYFKHHSNISRSRMPPRRASFS